MSMETAPQQAIDGVIVNAYQRMMQARALPMTSTHVNVHSAKSWLIETEAAEFNVHSYGGNERGGDPLAVHDLHVKDKVSGRFAMYQMTHGYDYKDKSTQLVADGYKSPAISDEEIFGLAGVTNAVDLSYFLRGHLDGAQTTSSRRDLTLLTRGHSMIKVSEERISQLGILSGRSTIEHDSMGSRHLFTLLASIHGSDSGPTAKVEKYLANDDQAQPEVLTNDRLQVVRDHLAMAITDLRRYNQEFLAQFPSSEWHNYPVLAPPATL